MSKFIYTSFITLLFSALLFSSCSTENSPVYTLTTSTSPNEGGTVEPTMGNFDENEPIRLRASPAEGWVFKRWELDLSSTVNPINITIDKDFSVIALFEKRETTTEVVNVHNPVTGQTWMDRNLGASRAATSITDDEAYGYLFQWGRAADRHENRRSPTTDLLNSTDTPEHSDFILTSSYPFDWRTPQNETLWQGASGNNNPCPEGYRLPTSGEWEAEKQSWRTNDADGAFASPLKLPVGGYRGPETGVLTDAGSQGHYWSSTVSGAISRSIRFNDGVAGMENSYRASGFAVRCIKS